MMHPIITPETYNAAEAWSDKILSDHDVVYNPARLDQAVKAKALQIDFPSTALMALVRNVSVNHIKRTAPGIKRQVSFFVKQWYQQQGSILQLARDLNYSPYLLARGMAEEICAFKGNNNTKKKLIAEAMRDPENQLELNVESIGAHFLVATEVTLGCNKTDEKSNDQEKQKARQVTMRLARDVREAIDFDPFYGPMHDKERYLVGIEYEVVLEQQLKVLGIPFETEEALRGLGTSRTPDILLQCPMSVQVRKVDGTGLEWKMISWIDSKAMFGDVKTHQSSVLPQTEAYVHRHGPGMVLYWFGHAPLVMLDNSQGDIVIVGWDLPERWMWPTGELLKNNN